ncbi:4-hydroxythreonine-4-phosphate dehydrogenase PdxA [Rhodoplanes elegans]|uniref:4-hydroxythreonine-4-phosphate dehydrogenase n=1 Tax=Rhodoplanes elegans TaxID=29408 RepID=A0A327KI94_9BRAD|nr:4-hydroxythreonine-4-phosphate dehydrogenase PdxA [Rhodoplanes elegans]MBK5960772.1 4-hydroxythreonine-4-phosphate dehydrogenase PdxA [Rhodoplanes elegans]RAI38509.1 4-hydroxythreonine-4-phosphate dehydrogenase PdxA [Rhodoplanes elegans]
MTRAGPPLALTLGEPAGIGPDITLLAWQRRAAAALPAFALLASPDLMRTRAKALGLAVPIETVGLREAAAVFPRALPVVDLGLPVGASPGRPDASSAPAAIAAIDRAVAAVTAGEASAVVTNPIAKHVLYAAGFRQPGHTEYLAELAGRHAGRASDDAPPRPVMMLWSPTLAVVPVTIHVPLARVPELVTRDLIVATGRIVARDLVARFGIARPRLAVAGLDPHAGEGGTIGTADRDVVAPAVAALVAAGIAATGPLPADTLFHEAARKNYDAALCMYHDQALIPIKTLAFHDAVNVTLGLPFVRTSPDHGTAFDIAGTGTADPSSLIAALRLAARLAGHAPAGETAVA